MLEQVEGVMTGERLQAIPTAGDEPGERDSLAQESAMTTVLVVHRDRGNVAWLNDCLEKAGFRVVVAQDGLTGLDLARRESPELILLNLTPLAPHGRSSDDASEREGDGCEFLRRLRRESKAGVIALSRRDDEATVQAALQAGTDDCLAWPCSRIELLARLRAVLRRCRQ
jgi:DNA-binding response OmpR family regulator